MAKCYTCGVPNSFNRRQFQTSTSYSSSGRYGSMRTGYCMKQICNNCAQSYDLEVSRMAEAQSEFWRKTLLFGFTMAAFVGVVGVLVN